MAADGPVTPRRAETEPDSESESESECANIMMHTEEPASERGPLTSGKRSPECHGELMSRRGRMGLGLLKCEPQ